MPKRLIILIHFHDEKPKRKKFRFFLLNYFFIYIFCVTLDYGKR